MRESCDLVIAGGGPVGGFLALALNDLPLTLMHVDSPSVSADRPIALAHGSRLLLDRVAAFEREAMVEAIRAAGGDASDRGRDRFGPDHPTPIGRGKSSTGLHSARTVLLELRSIWFGRGRTRSCAGD